MTTNYFFSWFRLNYVFNRPMRFGRLGSFSQRQRKCCGSSYFLRWLLFWTCGFLFWLRILYLWRFLWRLLYIFIALSCLTPFLLTFILFILLLFIFFRTFPIESLFLHRSTGTPWIHLLHIALKKLLDFLFQPLHIRFHLLTILPQPLQTFYAVLFSVSYNIFIII